jgi:hypothetical protein
MSNAASKPNLYDACKAAGLEMDHHESDLYVLDTVAAREVIRTYNKAALLRGTFQGTDGRRWIDLPFEYAPFWVAKSK